MGQDRGSLAGGFRPAPAQLLESERSEFSLLNTQMVFMGVLTSQIKHHNQDKLVI